MSYYLNVCSCNFSISSKVHIVVGTTPVIGLIEYFFSLHNQVTFYQSISVKRLPIKRPTFNWWPVAKVLKKLSAVLCKY